MSQELLDELNNMSEEQLMDVQKKIADLIMKIDAINNQNGDIDND